MARPGTTHLRSLERLPANGSTSFSGWALKDANTPDYVTLKTTGVAAGTYTVVLKANTTWKDYYYTVKVNVQ